MIGLIALALALSLALATAVLEVYKILSKVNDERKMYFYTNFLFFPFYVTGFVFFCYFFYP